MHVTYTRFAIIVDIISWMAVTTVISWQVLTCMLAFAVVDDTFINICKAMIIITGCAAATALY